MMKPEQLAKPLERCSEVPWTMAGHRSIVPYQVARSRFRCGIALSALLCLAACASPWPKGAYAQIVLDRPLPVSEADRQTECAWIRYEIGRQQEITARRAVFAEGREALMNRVTFEQNLMVLESRAKAARCNE